MTAKEWLVDRHNYRARAAMSRLTKQVEESSKLRLVDGRLGRVIVQSRDTDVATLAMVVVGGGRRPGRAGLHIPNTKKNRYCKGKESLH